MGRPIAPARLATEVSTEMTRSTRLSTAAVSSKSRSRIAHMGELWDARERLDVMGTRLVLNADEGQPTQREQRRESLKRNRAIAVVGVRRAAPPRNRDAGRGEGSEARLPFGNPCIAGLDIGYLGRDGGDLGAQRQRQASHGAMHVEGGKGVALRDDIRNALEACEQRHQFRLHLQHDLSSGGEPGAARSERIGSYRRALLGMQ